MLKVHKEVKVLKEPQVLKEIQDQVGQQEPKVHKVVQVLQVLQQVQVHKEPKVHKVQQVLQGQRVILIILTYTRLYMMLVILLMVVLIIFINKHRLLAYTLTNILPKEIVNPLLVIGINLHGLIFQVMVYS